MKIAIFTSNAIRHKFFANTLAKTADDALVFSECKSNDASDRDKTDDQSPLIAEHFRLRYETEKKFFTGNDHFINKCVPLNFKEANLFSTYQIVKKFNPDLMFVFGSSIIREPLLSLLPPGRFINLHLGISPYYRGSGTNFWPFVNNELEYVGSTILHIDAGVDTGDIIVHVSPEIEEGDTVHTVGCKVIKSSIAMLEEIMKIVKSGMVLNRVKQWQISDGRYYRKKDFNEEVLSVYKSNLENGIIKKYLENPKKEIQLIISPKK